MCVNVKTLFLKIHFTPYSLVMLTQYYPSFISTPGKHDSGNHVDDS